MQSVDDVLEDSCREVAFTEQVRPTDEHSLENSVLSSEVLRQKSQEDVP